MSDGGPRKARFQGVDRVVLRVPNVEAAAKYYDEVLGLCVDRRQPRVAAMKFATGGPELILHDDHHRGDLEVVIAVADVRALREKADYLQLTFLTPPSKSGNGWRATVRDPFGNVWTIADKGGEPSADPDAEAGGLFGEAEADIEPNQNRGKLIEAYTQIARTADDLPYTPHFERLYSIYTRFLAEPLPDRNAVWVQLLRLRKAGKLPKLGVAASKPPKIDRADRDKLLALLGDDIGKRDRLPYTPRCDEIVAAFNRNFARAWSPHVVWRLIATLAK